MGAPSRDVQSDHNEQVVISVEDYDRAYYLRPSHKEFDINGPVRRGPAAKVEWFSHLIPHRTVLDAGCGRGEQVRLMAELGADLVVGLEWSPQGVEIARQFCANTPRTLIIEGDARVFDPGVKFNVVTMYDFIEHLTQEDARMVYARCATRWLAKHGWLCVLCPPKSKHKYHLYHQSRDTLRGDIERVGLEVRYLSAHRSGGRSSRIFVVMAQKGR